MSSNQEILENSRMFVCVFRKNSGQRKSKKVEKFDFSKKLDTLWYDINVCRILDFKIVNIVKSTLFFLQ